ncbi:hypothetical protein BgiMline_015037, partial [Biomphalaria glabrata]
RREEVKGDLYLVTSRLSRHCVTGDVISDPPVQSSSGALERRVSMQTLIKST